MNAADVLKYGQETLLRTLDEIPSAAWETKGVCGWWSAKNIIAHLASYELVLNDILRSFLGEKVTPMLELYTSGAFNDRQVEIRQSKSPAETLAELQQAHTQVMTLIVQIPAETIRRPGTIPWYGEEYALDDLICYMYYGHKREHSAQIAVFKDTLKLKS